MAKKSFFGGDDADVKAEETSEAKAAPPEVIVPPPPEPAGPSPYDVLRNAVKEFLGHLPKDTVSLHWVHGPSDYHKHVKLRAKLEELL